jgi:hypothetical protein
MWLPGQRSTPPMYHELPAGASLWPFLLAIDRELAQTAQRQGCSCGGRLHRADFPRKPRGQPDPLPDAYRRRFSFCCDREGCRKRTTPPSVRFLGRKVYLASVVVLVSAMRQGPSPRRVRELSRLFGADRRTIARWQLFWRDQFPQSPFWKVARSRFTDAASVTAALPAKLLEMFLHRSDSVHDWGRLLEFLSPITISGTLAIKQK